MRTIESKDLNVNGSMRWFRREGGVVASERVSAGVVLDQALQGSGYRYRFDHWSQ